MNKKNKRLMTEVAKYFLEQSGVFLSDKESIRLNSPKEAGDCFGIWVKDYEGQGPCLVGVIKLRRKEIWGRFFGITGNISELGIVFYQKFGDFGVACDFALVSSEEELKGLLHSA